MWVVYVSQKPKSVNVLRKYNRVRYQPKSFTTISVTSLTMHIKKIKILGCQLLKAK